MTYEKAVNMVSEYFDMRPSHAKKCLGMAKILDGAIKQERDRTIDRVLEIIDVHLQTTHNRLNTFDSPFVDEWIRCKNAVLALKGELG